MRAHSLAYIAAISSLVGCAGRSIDTVDDTRATAAEGEGTAGEGEGASEGEGVKGEGEGGESGEGEGEGTASNGEGEGIDEGGEGEGTIDDPSTWALIVHDAAPPLGTFDDGFGETAAAVMLDGSFAAFFTVTASSTAEDEHGNPVALAAGGDAGCLVVDVGADGAIRWQTALSLVGFAVTCGEIVASADGTAAVVGFAVPQNGPNHFARGILFRLDESGVVIGTQLAAANCTRVSFVGWADGSTLFAPAGDNSCAWQWRDANGIVTATLSAGAVGLAGSDELTRPANLAAVDDVPPRVIAVSNGTGGEEAELLDDAGPVWRYVMGRSSGANEFWSTFDIGVDGVVRIAGVFGYDELDETMPTFQRWVSPTANTGPPSGAIIRIHLDGTLDAIGQNVGPASGPGSSSFATGIDGDLVSVVATSLYICGTAAQCSATTSFVDAGAVVASVPFSAGPILHSGEAVVVKAIDFVGASSINVAVPDAEVLIHPGDAALLRAKLPNAP